MTGNAPNATSVAFSCSSIVISYKADKLTSVCEFNQWAWKISSKIPISHQYVNTIGYKHTKQ